MFTNEGNENYRGIGKRIRAYQLLPLFIALVFALTVNPAKAHAQIVGNIVVTIPFQFHAGNAKLPAGKYTLRVLDDTDLKVMEITSADGSTAALFEIRDDQATSAPAKTELVFNKYGNSYFLAKIFDEGNPEGSSVIESRYERSVSKETAAGQEHVPAQHLESRLAN